MHTENPVLRAQSMRVQVRGARGGAGGDGSWRWISTPGKFTLDSVRPRKDSGALGRGFIPSFILVGAGGVLRLHPLHPQAEACNP